MARKTLFYLIFFIFLASNASAFLISPPKIDLQLQPGLQQEYTITLFNNRQETLTLQTYVKYDFLPQEVQQILNNTIQLDSDVITFSPLDASKSFNAKLTLPSSLPTGSYDIRIGAVEQAVTGVVGSRSANEVRLLIYSGVPVGTQPDTTIGEEKNQRSLPSVEQSQPSENQKPAAGQVVPFSSKNFTLQVVTTFIITFLFLILLILFYILIKKKSEALSVVSLDATFQHSDSNVKIESIVRNKSFEVINDIYIDFQVIDSDQKIIHTINIGPISIKPASEGVITRLWEAKNAKPGEYSVRLLLYYHKKAIMKLSAFSII